MQAERDIDELLGGLEPDLGLQRYLRGREREQPVEIRAFELLASEEDVAQPH